MAWCRQSLEFTQAAHMDGHVHSASGKAEISCIGQQTHRTWLWSLVVGEIKRSGVGVEQGDSGSMG